MKDYDVSIRCYFPGNRSNTHHQRLKLTEIKKWIESYEFTHPSCEALSVKVWLHDKETTTCEPTAEEPD